MNGIAAFWFGASNKWKFVTQPDSWINKNILNLQQYVLPCWVNIALVGEWWVLQEYSGCWHSMWSLCTPHCVEVLMKLQLAPVSEGNLAKGKWEHSLWRWHPWLINKKQALVFSECAHCESWMLIQSNDACQAAEKTTRCLSYTEVPPQWSVGCVKHSERHFCGAFVKILVVFLLSHKK